MARCQVSFNQIVHLLRESSAICPNPRKNQVQQTSEKLQIFFKEVSQIASFVGILNRFFAQARATQIGNSGDDGHAESRPNLISLVLDKFSAADGAVRLGL
jgi:hypothetical protein